MNQDRHQLMTTGRFHCLHKNIGVLDNSKFHRLVTKIRTTDLSTIRYFHLCSQLSIGKKGSLGFFERKSIFDVIDRIWLLTPFRTRFFEVYRISSTYPQIKLFFNTVATAVFNKAAPRFTSIVGDSRADRRRHVNQRVEKRLEPVSRQSSERHGLRRIEAAGFHQGGVGFQPLMKSLQPVSRQSEERHALRRIETAGLHQGHIGFQPSFMSFGPLPPLQKSSATPFLKMVVSRLYSCHDRACTKQFPGHGFNGRSQHHNIGRAAAATRSTPATGIDIKNELSGNLPDKGSYRCQRLISGAGQISQGILRKYKKNFQTFMVTHVLPTAKAPLNVRALIKNSVPLIDRMDPFKAVAVSRQLANSTAGQILRCSDSTGYASMGDLIAVNSRHRFTTSRVARPIGNPKKDINSDRQIIDHDVASNALYRKQPEGGSTIYFGGSAENIEQTVERLVTKNIKQWERKKLNPKKIANETYKTMVRRLVRERERLWR